MKLIRTGDAKVVVAKPSPPVAPEFVGSWEGTITWTQLGNSIALNLKKAAAAKP